MFEPEANPTFFFFLSGLKVYNVDSPGFSIALFASYSAYSLAFSSSLISFGAT
jgi:hypothetical protein